jgi:flavin-dependent dehydrogenase
MTESEIIIVGGGPAGSAAAWELKKNNREVLILDKAKFPRVKLCAGWVTPKVFRLLNTSPSDYPYGILKFDKLYYDFGLLRFPLPTTQFSVRRYEFDNWLHEISGVKIVQHEVKEIQKKNGEFIIDGEYKCKYLIGAGGTYCPVYRTFFANANPRSNVNKIVAMEEEFPYDWQEERCLLWFGDLKLRGYAWYVPKANGYLNIGLGGTFEGLKQDGKNIKYYWEKFTQKLETLGLVRNHKFNAKGYSYFLRSNVEKARVGNAFIVGDAVGLATLDMGEGIAPAIESGILAAKAITENKEYSIKTIAKYSLGSLLFAKRFLKGLRI